MAINTKRLKYKTINLYISFPSPNSNDFCLLSYNKEDQERSIYLLNNAITNKDNIEYINVSVGLEFYALLKIIFILNEKEKPNIEKITQVLSHLMALSYYLTYRKFDEYHCLINKLKNNIPNELKEEYKEFINSDNCLDDVFLKLNLNLI